MSIEFKNKTGNRFFNSVSLKKLTSSLIDFLLPEEGMDSGIVSIIFVDDKEIQKLNLEYMKKDRPTDVLSFSMLEGDDIKSQEDELRLGDIAISLETAERQASENNQSLEDEIILLVTHGFLHLLSYDDEEKENRKIMFKRTNELIRKFKEIYKK